MNVNHPKVAPFSRFILSEKCAATKCLHSIHGNSAGVAGCGNCLFHLACTENIAPSTPCVNCHIAIGPLDTKIFTTCLRSGCSKKACGLCKECCRDACSLVETQGNCSVDLASTSARPCLTQPQSQPQRFGATLFDWADYRNNNKKLAPCVGEGDGEAGGGGNFIFEVFSDVPCWDDALTGSHDLPSN